LTDDTRAAPRATETEAGAAAAPASPAAPADATEKSIVRDYIETILICVIFVIFSRAFVFQQSKIPSGSMEDTLLVGDYIMVNRFVYAPVSFAWERSLLPIRPIRREDIIVFKQPQEPEVDYIKRIAGVPGDRVEVRHGFLFVNGKPVDEPWVEDRYRIGIPNQRPMTVPEGQYFVLGDHRNSSSDSRVWGFVPRELIKGRALLVWYSFDEQRAASAYPDMNQRVHSWVQKARYFFTRTRWERCFTLIR
jgi:signal peptidase I